MTKPITPDECVGSIPDVIIECVNEFLKARGGSHEITITQDEPIERICARTEYERHQIFSNNWLARTLKFSASYICDLEKEKRAWTMRLVRKYLNALAVMS